MGSEMCIRDRGLVGILLFRFLAKVAAPQLKQLGVLDDNPEVAHA